MINISLAHHEADNEGISVVVTAYNRRTFLSHALDSLMKQTFHHFEVILITNFPFDVTKYHNIDIQHFVESGTVGNFLYTGVTKSRYDIICFLDDDDLFYENKLEYISRTFIDKRVVYCHNNYNIINEHGRVVQRMTKPTVTSNLSAISIKRSMINLRILKNIVTSQDLLMYLFALNNGGKILDINTKLSFYRRHSLNNPHFSRENIPSIEFGLNQLAEFERVFLPKECKKIINQHIYDMQLSIKCLTPVREPLMFIKLLVGLSMRLKLYQIRIFLKYFYKDYISRTKDDSTQD